MPRPSHPPWRNHPHNILWIVRTMKLLFMQFSPGCCFIFPRIRPSPCVTFRHVQVFYGVGLLALSHKPQPGEPPLVSCPRLLVQYIHSYPPYLEAVSSIRNLRTHHVVLTDDPPQAQHGNWCSFGWFRTAPLVRTLTFQSNGSWNNLDFVSLVACLFVLFSIGIFDRWQLAAGSSTRR
jgi:hypothetical protein